MRRDADRRLRRREDATAGDNAESGFPTDDWPELGVVTYAGQYGGSQGQVVVRVVPGSAAEKAGLVPGDVILTFNGKPVPSADDLDSAMDNAGGKFEVVVWDARTGRKSTLDGTLDPAASRRRRTKRRDAAGSAIDRAHSTPAKRQQPGRISAGLFYLFKLIARKCARDQRSILAEIQRRHRAAAKRFERELLRHSGQRSYSTSSSLSSPTQVVFEVVGAHEPIVDLVEIVAVVVDAAVGILTVAAGRDAKHETSVALRVEHALANVARVVTVAVKHGVNPFH